MTQHQQVSTTIPLPPPPPPAGHVTPIPSSVTDTDNERKTPTHSKTFEVNGEQVPSALASAFATPNKDKLPFSYFKGELQPGTTPSAARRESRRQGSQTPTSTTRVLPIVPPETLQEINEDHQVFRPVTPKKQPPPVAPKPVSPFPRSPSVTLPRSTVDDFSYTTSVNNYRPLQFVPEQPRGAYYGYNSQPATPTYQTLPRNHQIRNSQAFEMPSIAHLQYNSPMGMYSSENAAAAFEQQTRGIQPSFAGTPTPGARQEPQPIQTPAPTADRSTTPHSHHGIVSTAQSPSFKKLQLSTNAGNHSEANEVYVQNYEQQQLHGGQQRATTPTVVISQPPPSHQRAPMAAQYEHGVEQMPIDDNLAAKLNAAEAPNVPPPVTPSWARHATDKQSNWQQAHGFDPMVQLQQQYQYQPEQPDWARQAQQPAAGGDDKWERHYGYINGRPRSTTPGPHPASRYEMGGHDYNRPVDYHRAQSVEPSRSGWRASPRHQGLSPRQPHQSNVSAAANEWLKPYVAPNVRGNDREMNFGTVLANVDTLNSHAHCQPQNLREIGTYFGHRAGGHTQGHGAAGGQHRYGHPGYDVSTDYSRYRQTEEQQAQWRVHQERHERELEQQRMQEAWAQQQANGQAGGLSVNTGHGVHMPPVDGLSPHQREMGTNFLESHEQPHRQPGQSHFSSSHHTQSRVQSGGVNSGVQPSTLRGNTPVRETSVPRSGVDGGALTQHVYGSGYRGTSQDRFGNNYRANSQDRSSHRSTYNASTNYSTTRSGTTPVPSGTALNEKMAPLAGGSTNINNWRTQQGPNWYTASGGNTKATTSGDYIDGDGNKVHYTKELYQNNDAANPCSTLTEEERKVMEEPLQPGVISRHVTTKYYKKSTYANQQSSTTSMPSSSTFPAVRAPSVPIGHVAPGLTQF